MVVKLSEQINKIRSDFKGRPFPELKSETPVGRIIYCCLDKPEEESFPGSGSFDKFEALKKNCGDDKAKLNALKVNYSVTLGIEKTKKNEEYFNLMVEQTKQALADCGYPNWRDGGPISSKLDHKSQPFQDGDTSGKEIFEGYYVVKAKRKSNYGFGNRIFLVDANLDKVETSSFYPGCYARMSIKPYTWYSSIAAGYGFSLHLGTLQFIRDGEPLSSNSDNMVLSAYTDELDKLSEDN